MHWIIDLVLLLIILLCAWRGFRNGLIAGILAVCAVLFSIYAADILADTYSGEFTKMLEPFVTGAVDTASSAAEDYYEKKGTVPTVYNMTEMTVEGVALGELLFNDPHLCGYRGSEPDSLMSCATCHRRSRRKKYISIPGTGMSRPGKVLRVASN